MKAKKKRSVAEVSTGNGEWQAAHLSQGPLELLAGLSQQASH